MAFNALPADVQASLKLTNKQIYNLDTNDRTANGIINKYEYDKLQKDQANKYLYIGLSVPPDEYPNDGYNGSNWGQRDPIRTYKPLYSKTIPGWRELRLKQDAINDEVDKKLASKTSPLKEQLIKERDEKLKNIRRFFQSQDIYDDAVHQIRREYNQKIKEMEENNKPTDLCVLTNDYQRCKDILPYKNPFSYKGWPENLIPTPEEIRARYTEGQKAGKKRATKKSRRSKKKSKKSRKTKSKRT